MFFIKNINFSYVFSFLVSSSFAASSVPEQNSPFTGLPLQSECQETYKKGIAVYQEGVEKRITDYVQYFSEEASKIPENCSSDFSLALLDARMFFQQALSVEFLFELEFATNQFKANPEKIASYHKAMRTLFAQKFKHAFLDPSFLDTLDLQNPESKKGLAAMTLRLLNQSRNEFKPIQFGRFVFTQVGRPLTAFEYVVSASGEIEELPTGELKVEKGSYEKKAEALLSAAVEVAQAYLEYRPKMVFGEDSLLAATLEEKILGIKFKQTTRGYREAEPFEIVGHLNRIAFKMFLDLKPFNQILQHMVEKQRAVLERDIQATRAVLTGMVVLPVLPYAIKFGSWALRSYGTKLAMDYVAGAGVWKLHVGAFLYSHASVISVGSSLVALVAARGFQVYDAVLEYRNDPKNFTGSHLADAIFVSIISAVPIATIAPLAVAGGTAVLVETTSFLMVETTQFLVQLSNGFKYARAVGWKPALIELAKTAPKSLVKSWCNAWWTRGPSGIVFHGKFVALVMAYNGAAILSEITYREAQDDPDQKFFTPNGVNKLSMYSLAQKVGLSILTGPIIKIENFWSRWAVWRFIDFVSSGLVTMAFDGGKVNTEYVTFEFIYGSTVSSAVGEVERIMTMKVLNNSHMSSSKSFWIQFAIKMAFTFPKTSMRAFAADLYFGHADLSVDEFKKEMKKNMGVELKNFTDEEIKEGIRLFKADKEVLEFMKLPIGERP